MRKTQSNLDEEATLWWRGGEPCHDGEAGAALWWRRNDTMAEKQQSQNLWYSSRDEGGCTLQISIRENELNHHSYLVTIFSPSTTIFTMVFSSLIIANASRGKYWGVQRSTESNNELLTIITTRLRHQISTENLKGVYMDHISYISFI